MLWGNAELRYARAKPIKCKIKWATTLSPSVPLKTLWETMLNMLHNGTTKTSYLSTKSHLLFVTNYFRIFNSLALPSSLETDQICLHVYSITQLRYLRRHCPSETISANKFPSTCDTYYQNLWWNSHLRELLSDRKGFNGQTIWGWNGTYHIPSLKIKYHLLAYLTSCVLTKALWTILCALNTVFIQLSLFWIICGKRCMH